MLLRFDSHKGEQVEYVIYILTIVNVLLSAQVFCMHRRYMSALEDVLDIIKLINATRSRLLQCPSPEHFEQLVSELRAELRKNQVQGCSDRSEKS